MAAEIARLAIDLDASGVSGAAGGAASALEQLKSKFHTASDEVRALQQAMQAMQKGGTSIDIAAFKDLQDKLTAARASQSAAAQGFAKLGGSMTDLVRKPEALAKGVRESSASFEQLTRASKGALGPMGGLFERAGALVKGIGEGGLTGVTIAATLALVAFAAAVWGGVFSLAKLAVERNAKAMRELATITKTAKENFDKLFAGVHVERFVTAFKDVLSIFDESTASAKALKALLETLLNPLFDSAQSFTPVIKVALKGIVAGFLMAAIAILYFKNVVRDLFPKDVISTATLLKAVFWTVAIATAVLTVSVAILAAAGTVLAAVLLVIALVALVALATTIVGVIAVMTLFIAVVLAIVAVLALFLAAVLVVGTVITAVLVAALLLALAVILLPFILPIAAIVLLIAYLDELGAALNALVDAGAAAARGMIDGLVNGITSGGAAVIAAVMGLASSAKGALMSALGIASPSRVFAALGKHTAHGFASGVDEGGASVDASVERMVSVPAAQVPADAKASGGVSGARAITIERIEVNGVRDADELTTDAFARRVADAVLADLAMQGV